MPYNGACKRVEGILMVCLAVAIAGTVSCLVWYHGVRLFCQAIVALEAAL